MGENGAHLFTAHHDWQTPGRSCSHRIAQSFELAPENLSVEEEESGERLVLCGGRYLPIHCEMREELHHLGAPHLVRMAKSVEVDIPPDPADVGLLGSLGIVANSQRGPDAVEQLRWMTGTAPHQPPA